MYTIFKTQENPTKNELVSTEVDKISGLQFINKYIQRFISAIYGDTYLHYFNVHRHRYVMSSEEWDIKKSTLPNGHYFVEKESKCGFNMYVICESVEVSAGMLWGQTEYIKKNVVHLGSIFGIETNVLDDSVLGIKNQIEDSHNNFMRDAKLYDHQHKNLLSQGNYNVRDDMISKLYTRYHSSLYQNYDQNQDILKGNIEYTILEPLDLEDEHVYVPKKYKDILSLENKFYNELLEIEEGDDKDNVEYDTYEPEELKEYVCKKYLERNYCSYDDNAVCTCGWHLYTPDQKLSKKSFTKTYEELDRLLDFEIGNDSSDELDAEMCIEFGDKLDSELSSDCNSDCNSNIKLKPTTRIREAVNKLNESVVYKDAKEMVWTRIANEVKMILDEIKN